MIGKIILYVVIIYFITFGITMLLTFVINKIQNYKERKCLQEKGIIKRDTIKNTKNNKDEVKKIWNETLKCWEVQN